MQDTTDVSRRRILQTGAAMAAATTAGCSAVLGDGDSGGGTLFGQRVEEGELTQSFEAEAGDELSVTVEAEENGASVGIVPTEGEGSFGDSIGWGWELDPDGELEDEIEIEESDEYSVFVYQGAAHVTVE